MKKIFTLSAIATATLLTGCASTIQAEKAIKEVGEKADKALVEKVQKAADQLKESLKGTDIEKIKADVIGDRSLEDVIAEQALIIKQLRIGD